MLDRNEAQDGRNGHDLPRRDAAGEVPLADRPMADREVPLPGTPGGSTMALHQWLDGELPETEMRRTDAKQVEFWSRLATETDRRRRMTTPAYVADQIMAALPDKAVAMSTATTTATSVVQRIEGISMAMAMAIGAGMLVLGIVIGKML